MIVTINVTQGCIDHGIGGDCSVCPVALAIKPLLREGIFARVQADDVKFTSWAYAKIKPQWVDLPDEVAEFIRDFDRVTEVEEGTTDHPFVPFTFELDIPPRFLKEAA